MAKVKSLVNGLEGSSNDHVRGIEQVSAAMEQMSQVTQAIAASAEQNAAAVSELDAQSQALNGAAERLAALA